MAAASGADESLIYLIRHAEKPKDGCKGVDENGAADDKSLSPRGWIQRYCSLINAPDRRICGRQCPA
jgi:hypothetical protein